MKWISTCRIGCQMLVLTFCLIRLLGIGTSCMNWVRWVVVLECISLFRFFESLECWGFIAVGCTTLLWPPTTLFWPIIWDKNLVTMWLLGSVMRSVWIGGKSLVQIVKGGTCEGHNIPFMRFSMLWCFLPLRVLVTLELLLFVVQNEEFITTLTKISRIQENIQMFYVSMEHGLCVMINILADLYICLYLVVGICENKGECKSQSRTCRAFATL